VIHSGASAGLAVRTRMTDSETRTLLRSLVERRLKPSQTVLFMAWLELMLETEGHTFIRALQKRHVSVVAKALPSPFEPD
jgi:hypothetical protein